MTQSEWIVDVDTRTFGQAVLERSKALPVVVDFHAPWCEPCKTLGPLLERHASEGNGRFLLARIDVDQNPDLVQAFGVRGIPAVIALMDGKPVDAFEGAKTVEEVEQFLERVAPAGVETGALAEAEALAEAGEVPLAVKLLEAWLLEFPGDGPARIALTGFLLDLERAEEAGKVFSELSEKDADSPAAKAIKARISLGQDTGKTEEFAAAVEADPLDPSARIDLGKALVALGQYEEGLEHLLESVRIDTGHAGGAARKAMLEAFEVLGAEDPVANDFRFRLSLEIFA